MFRTKASLMRHQVNRKPRENTKTLHRCSRQSEEPVEAQRQVGLCVRSSEEAWRPLQSLGYLNLRIKLSLILVYS